MKNEVTNPPQYAGFWKRFAAFLIDAVVVVFLVVALDLSIVYMSDKPFEMAQDTRTLLMIITFWLYFAGMESSKHQATIGKKVLNIIVLGINGERNSFWRATGRHLAKFISYLTLGIGYIVAGFTKKKQALHDMIADCLVIIDDRKKKQTNKKLNISSDEWDDLSQAKTAWYDESSNEAVKLLIDQIQNKIDNEKLSSSEKTRLKVKLENLKREYK